MHFRTLIVTSIALFAAGIGSANSGPCAVEIDGLTKALASKDAGSGPTVGAGGQTQAPTRSGQHPPTAIMGQQTQGKATSPEDVRRQNQGQPTASEQGASGRNSGPNKTETADMALQRARTLDAQGKENECMETVRQAKELTGAK